MSASNVTVGAGEAGSRLDKWLKRRKPLTQGEIEKLLRTGQVRVDGARAKANTRLKAGQTVRLPPVFVLGRADAAERAPRSKSEPDVDPADADYIRSLVIFEDDELFALNKPAGLAVQGGTKMGRRHIDAYLPALESGGYRPRLVHRLDKETSGVLIIARTPAAAARLGKLFRSRELDKIYWAVTVSVPHPMQGQVRCWMAKGTGSEDEAERNMRPDRERMYRSAQGVERARHSVSDYAVISTAGRRAAWVALRPQTGRTHQLRLHMAELDAQILGDTKYTTRRERPGRVAEGLHLHARALLLPKPRGKPLLLEAPLPEHMAETFDTLGFSLSEAPADPLAVFEA